MGNVVKTRVFQRYLKAMGFYLKSVKGSHEHWDRKDKPLRRPITVDNAKDEVPEFHINNALPYLGISKKEFWKEIKNY
ncbi:MAG TPA: type II toxin-antitoxin system HicA family toxin [Ignavibacteriales bacterium]|nr:type II toxin-antitoxin system HicA family toxin [Ignavibacteriales bacterium]